MDSAYVKVLSEAGYRVITSHIDDGMDYFTYEPDNWTVMVSNPPFSKKDEVLERAYSLENLLRCCFLSMQFKEEDDLIFTKTDCSYYVSTRE